MRNTIPMLILLIILSLGAYGCELVDTTTEDTMTEIENDKVITNDKEAATTEIKTYKTESQENLTIKVENDTQLETHYQSVIEAYNELVTELALMSGDTMGLSRDAMSDLASQKDVLNTTHAQYITLEEGDRGSLRVIYTSRLSNFEKSYNEVKSKYKVQ